MNPPEDFLAHRRPLLLLDQILAHGPETIRARTRVDPGAWYADPDGAMPAWFGLELMAQTVAAYSGASKIAAGAPPAIGYLLGTRSFTCSRPRFPAGAELDLEARLNYLDESGLSAFHCRILLDGAVVAQALLKTFEDRSGGAGPRI